MGRRRVHFRLTKRGKIVVALLSTTLVLAVGTVFKWHPEWKFFSKSGYRNAVVNASAETEGEGGRIERIYMPDSDVKSTNKHIITNLSPKAVNNNSANPEIDEEFFNNTLFIGDSITEGISAYGLLDKSNILAAKGLTISKAEKEMDTIIKRKPGKIYILLGSNDLLYGMDSEKFSSEYLGFIQKIRDKLPDTKVYIQSIFPVSKDVENKKPLLTNSRIDEFNLVLERKAKEQGIGYIDIAVLLKDEGGTINKDFTSDGIHVKFKFYSIWLDCIKKNSL